MDIRDRAVHGKGHYNLFIPPGERGTASVIRAIDF